MKYLLMLMFVTIIGCSDTVTNPSSGSFKHLFPYENSNEYYYSVYSINQMKKEVYEYQARMKIEASDSLWKWHVKYNSSDTLEYDLPTCFFYIDSEDNDNIISFRVAYNNETNDFYVDLREDYKSGDILIATSKWISKSPQPQQSELKYIIIKEHKSIFIGGGVYYNAYKFPARNDIYNPRLNDVYLHQLNGMVRFTYDNLIYEYDSIGKI